MAGSPMLTIWNAATKISWAAHKISIGRTGKAAPATAWTVLA